MTTYFTADTHFGHANIIRYCRRPFASVEEMDAEMIRRWNSVVGPSDTVWHLGDFAWKSQAEEYARALNGAIHFVWGNHDTDVDRRLFRWESSQYAAEIKLDGHRVTLCHYAMRVWNCSHHGAVMLYGHTHGTLPGSRQSLDVGVDCWDFRPITLRQAVARMGGLPPIESIVQ